MFVVWAREKRKYIVAGGDSGEKKIIFCGGGAGKKENKLFVVGARGKKKINFCMCGEKRKCLWWGMRKIKKKFCDGGSAEKKTFVEGRAENKINF